MTDEEYIQQQIEEKNIKNTWVRLRYPYERRLWVDKNQKIAKYETLLIRNKYYSFDEDSHLMYGFLFTEIERNYQKSKIYIDDNLCPAEIELQVLLRYLRDLQYTDIALTLPITDKTSPGAWQSGEVKFKLKDKHTYTFLLGEDFTNVKNSIIDGVLNIRGLVVNKYLLNGPSSKYGTVLDACNNLYLCNIKGKVLNLEKTKYIDGEHIYYVNSDRTFFYSNDLDDKRWY